jgi:hypothetical protein
VNEFDLDCHRCGAVLGYEYWPSTEALLTAATVATGVIGTTIGSEMINMINCELKKAPIILVHIVAKKV